jgi:uncharacterized protein
LTTALLLLCSNVFMTFAWYGHLKYGHSWPLWKAIVVSWSIALIEYCLAVPANRWGYLHFSGFQLKILQEGITLSVFIVFAVLFSAGEAGLELSCCVLSADCGSRVRVRVQARGLAKRERSGVPLWPQIQYLARLARSPVGLEQ